MAAVEHAMAGEETWLVPWVMLFSMTMPGFQDMMLPVLQITADGQKHQLRDLADPIADQFGLCPEERELSSARANREFGGRLDGLLQKIRKSTRRWQHDRLLRWLGCGFLDVLWQQQGRHPRPYH
ncbi:MAG: hypothetical protein JJU36_07390 [Phycisphaeraceae bacterium]|nr:hypothetical protein [Phycisphaeraceae bacterium]